MSGSVVAASSLPQEWRVQLPIFEGPLELLLHLVRINEVEITDIPVATICDQFHEYLALLEELNLDIAAEFIYEAALLIQLKSKVLLPRSSFGEENSSVEDPRTPLVRRLLEYRRLREAAGSLAEVDRVRSGIFSKLRPQRPEKLVGEDGDELDTFEEISLFDLVGALRSVLERYQREHPEPLTVPLDRYPVRVEIEAFLGRLDPGQPLELIADLAARSSRLEAVAAFLAVLEMVRLGLLAVEHRNGTLVIWRTSRVVNLAELEDVAG